jgi:hypothetical protein
VPEVGRATLERCPPSYLVIDLSRFLIHLIPDFIAVPAFEKQNVTQPKCGNTKYDKEKNTHRRDSFCCSSHLDGTLR